MIRDIKSVYDQLVEMDPDVMGVTDKLTKGLYLRFDINKTLAENLADVEGNQLLVDKKFYSDGMEHDNKLHDWFVDRDVLSRLLDMNKPLHKAKKIHTNNMFSFSIRESSFVGQSFGILETFLTGYYARVGELPTDYIEMFREVGERVTSEELVERFEQAYPDLSSYVYGEERAEMFGKVYDIMVTGSEELETFLRSAYGEMFGGSYVKIFFDVPIPFYVNERRLYADTRIFGNTKYNTIGNTGLPSGVPLNDYNMNEKKNFLRLRASDIDVSVLNTIEEEALRQELFKWINSGVFADGNVMSVSMSEEFNTRLRNHARLFMQTKDFSISSYDSLSFDRPSEVSIGVFNYLEGAYAIKKETKIEDMILRIMRTYFNVNLFDNQIRKINEHDLGNGGIITGEMNNYFIGIRNDLYNWYHTGNEKGIANKFDKFSLNVIRAFVTHCMSATAESIEGYNKNPETHLMEMLNLRWSLLAYFGVGSLKAMGDEILDTLEWFKSLRESRSDEITIADDRQFYFVAGQLFKYLNEQSKSNKEGMHYLKKSMACNSPEAVKSEIARLLGLYGHSIFPNYRFFNRSVAGIMAYPGGTKNSKTARDMITVGMFSDNVFFAAMSKEELEEINTEDKGEI